MGDERREVSKGASGYERGYAFDDGEQGQGDQHPGGRYVEGAGGATCEGDGGGEES